MRRICSAATTPAMTTPRRQTVGQSRRTQASASSAAKTLRATKMHPVCVHGAPGNGRYNRRSGSLSPRCQSSRINAVAVFASMDPISGFQITADSARSNGPVPTSTTPPHPNPPLPVRFVKNRPAGGRPRAAGPTRPSRPLQQGQGWNPTPPPHPKRPKAPRRAPARCGLPSRRAGAPGRGLPPRPRPISHSLILSPNIPKSRPPPRNEEGDRPQREAGGLGTTQEVGG